MTSCAAHAFRSILSSPTPRRPMHRSLGAAARSAPVTSVRFRTTSAAASLRSGGSPAGQRGRDRSGPPLPHVQRVDGFRVHEFGDDDHASRRRTGCAGCRSRPDEARVAPSRGCGLRPATCGSSAIPAWRLLSSSSPGTERQRGAVEDLQSRFGRPDRHAHILARSTRPHRGSSRAPAKDTGCGRSAPHRRHRPAFYRSEVKCRQANRCDLSCRISSASTGR